MFLTHSSPWLLLFHCGMMIHFHPLYTQLSRDFQPTSLLFFTLLHFGDFSINLWSCRNNKEILPQVNLQQSGCFCFLFVWVFFPPTLDCANCLLGGGWTLIVYMIILFLSYFLWGKPKFQTHHHRLLLLTGIGSLNVNIPSAKVKHCIVVFSVKSNVHYIFHSAVTFVDFSVLYSALILSFLSFVNIFLFSSLSILKKSETVKQNGREHQ